MKTRRIADLEVSAIGLGAMPLSLHYDRPTPAEAVRVIAAALDAGMTFIDTADVYCTGDPDIGHNERLVARALRELGRTDIVVATKGGLRRPNGRWAADGRPEHLKAACEASLHALGVERIDLYQLHARDVGVPYADSVGALAELKQAGKIRHVGLSNIGVAELEQARSIVDIASVQNRCNPFETQSFASGVVRWCAERAIAFLPHSPVGGHRKQRRVADHPTLNAVAERHGATAFEVCLAWLLELSPAVIPIPGASKVSSARSSAAAAELALAEEDLAELRRAFPTVSI